MGDDERQDAQDLALDVGSGLVSTSAGFMIGGPVGAIAGAVIGPVFGRVGRAMVDRYDRRDQTRSLTALGYAALTVAERFEQGQELRSDWFDGEEVSPDRGAADEIAEAALKAAALDPEERKLRYYGELLGNLAFRPEVSRFDANRLVRISSTLTYRQYIVLALAADEPIRPPYDGVELEWAGDDSPVDASWALLRHECDELESLRLIAPERHRHNNRVLTRAGEQLVDLMGLRHIAEGDQTMIHTLLVEKARQPPLED